MTIVFYIFRKTLLVQFSRNISDKPIGKYHVPVCLKKVSFLIVVPWQTAFITLVSCYSVQHHHSYIPKMCFMCNLSVFLPLSGLQWCVRIYACGSQPPPASWLWVRPKSGSVGPNARLWNAGQRMATTNRPTARPGPGTHNDTHAGKKGGRNYSRKSKLSCKSPQITIRKADTILF